MADIYHVIFVNNNNHCGSNRNNMAIANNNYYLPKVCQVASVVSDSVRPQRRQPIRILRSWDSPGKNTGVGCHFLLQGILPTQVSNPRLSRLWYQQVDSLPLSRLGSP